MRPSFKRWRAAPSVLDLSLLASGSAIGANFRSKQHTSSAHPRRSVQVVVHVSEVVGGGVGRIDARRLSQIDRDECRNAAERRFSLQRMARDHERFYRRVLEREVLETLPPTGETLVTA